MKKILAILLSVLTLFLFVSCTVSDENLNVENDVNVLEMPEEDANNADGTEAQAQDENAEEAEAEQDTAVFSSVEEYLNAYPKDFEGMAEAYGDAMQFSVSARGNLMVFSFTSEMFDFIYENGETMDGIKEYLDPIVDRMANSMGQAVIEGKKEVPSLQGIAMEYNDSKGNLIYSRVITEEDAYKDYGEGSDVDISTFGEEMTIEQWVENLSNQDLNTDAGVLNVYADGNVIVYVNTFEEGVTANDIDTEALESYHVEMTETAIEAKGLIKMQVPDLEGIRYEYVLSDGTVIYSYQY